MNCQETQERLPARAFDALPDQETSQLDQHLSGCDRCRAELDSVRARLGLLAQWSEPEPAPDLAARTLDRLHAEPLRLPWWKRIAQAIDEALGRFASSRLTPARGLAAVAVTMALLIPVLSPNWTRARSSGALTGCRTNLRLMGKALDRYAADHQGQYPKTLGEMSPDYIRLFPECPRAGSNTYTAGYKRSQDGMHYNLACQGAHHKDEGVPDDEPRIRR